MLPAELCGRTDCVDTRRGGVAESDVEGDSSVDDGKHGGGPTVTHRMSGHKSAAAIMTGHAQREDAEQATERARGGVLHAVQWYLLRSTITEVCAVLILADTPVSNFALV